MAKVRGGYRADHDNGRHVSHKRGAGFVGEVGKYWQVLVISLLHAVRAHGQGAGPDKEHGEDGQQDGGVADNLIGLCVVVRAVFLFHAQRELGDRSNEGEGENQYGKDKDDGLDNAASSVIAGLHEGTQVPLWDEVERYCCQRYDERVDHELGNLEHDGVAKGERECHEAHAQRCQDVAGDFRAAQLVDDEAIDRIRNRYAVD